MKGWQALAATVAGVILTGALLWVVPSFADSLTRGATRTMGEAIFTLAVFGPLLVLGLAGGALTKVPAWSFGDRAGPNGSIGLVLGVGGFLLASAYAAIAGTIHNGGQAAIGATILLGLLVIALQVGAEEVVFRGWLQPLLARATGLPVALVAVAVIFALLHLLAGASGVVSLLNLGLGGVLFGLLAVRGGGIAGAFGAHFGWNASEQLLLGLDPNPGVSSFGSLVDLDLVGAANWGGSNDGLNASWAMTFSLVSIVVPLVLLARQKAGQS